MVTPLMLLATMDDDVPSSDVCHVRDHHLSSRAVAAHSPCAHSSWQRVVLRQLAGFGRTR